MDEKIRAMTIVEAHQLVSAIAAEDIVVNTCALGEQIGRKYVRELKYLADKDSASPTTIVFASLIRNNKSLRVALKISFDLPYSDYQALVYEAMVYKYVIDNIVSH